MIGIPFRSARQTPTLLALDPLLKIITNLLIFSVLSIKVQPVHQLMEMIILIELFSTGIKIVLVMGLKLPLLPKFVSLSTDLIGGNVSRISGSTIRINSFMFLRIVSFAMGRNSPEIPFSTFSLTQSRSGWRVFRAFRKASTCSSVASPRGRNPAFSSSPP